MSSGPVTFTYRNWKGVVSRRRVDVLGFWWGKTPYHEACWLLHAFDLDKRAIRDFAVSGISDWKDHD